MASAAVGSTPNREIARRNGSSILVISGFLIYAGLLLVATVSHTFWHDEAQAWLIARDSTGFVSLLHNSRYEGHPPLWHFILYLITRVTWNVEWMKLPNYISAIAAAVLILRAGRTSIGVRLSFLFSYYMLFEYGVIARNYMIGVALLLGAVSLTSGRRCRPLLSSTILLSLAALTSLPALIVAVCLFVVVYYTGIKAARAEAVSLQRAVLDRTMMSAAALFTVSVVLSLVTIAPPADSAALLDGLHRAPNLLDRALWTGIWLGRGYLAIPTWKHNFWEDRSWSFPTLLLLFAFGYGALIAFTSYLRNQAIRWFYVSSTVFLLVELMISVKDAQRHLGWFFVVLMCSILLDDARPSSNTVFPTPKIARVMLGITLLCQVAVAAFGVVVSFRYPFSPSKRVAEFIRERHLEEATLIPVPFNTGAALLSYLQRPYAYDARTQQYASFVTWDRDEFLNGSSLPDPAMLRSLRDRGKPVLLITGMPLSSEDMLKLNVSPISSFTQAICSADTYYLYLENHTRAR